MGRSQKSGQIVGALVLTALVASGRASAEARRPTTLSVLYFDNTSGDRALDPLRKGFADMLITDLTGVGTLRVVEREKVEALLKEIRLGETRFVDPKTAQRLGRGLAAQYVVTGSFLTQRDAVRVDVRVVRVETGEVLVARAVDGKKTEFFSLEKKLVDLLVKELGRVLGVERPLPLESKGTSSFDAFEAYSSGLDASDNGRAAEALVLFEKAVRSDPEYRAAKHALARAQALGGIVERRTTDELAEVERSVASGDPVAAERITTLLLRLDEDETPENLGRQARLLTIVARHGLKPVDGGGALLEMKGLLHLIDSFPDDAFADAAPQVIEYLYRKYADRAETSSLKKRLQKIEPMLELRRAVAAHRNDIEKGLPFIEGTVSEEDRELIRAMTARMGGCSVATVEKRTAYDRSGWAVLNCSPADYLAYVKKVREREWNPDMMDYPWGMCFPYKIDDEESDPSEGFGTPPRTIQSIKAIDRWIAARKSLDPVRPDLKALAEAIVRTGRAPSSK